MYRKTSILALVFLTILAIAPAVQAITFGQPDGDSHPNVGAMIVQEPDENLYFYCSGTLIAPNVFLTAAHCTAAAAANGAAPGDVFVTFDPVLDENATLHMGTYYLNPNYGHDMHDLNDVAVIILDEVITDITPAELPIGGVAHRIEKG